MNSKQRVLTALSHREPDRVPADFLKTLDQVTEGKLYAYFGIRTYEELLRRLRTDFRQVLADYAGPKLPTYPDGGYADIWGVVRVPVKNPFGKYDEVRFQPFAEMKSMAEVRRYPWPEVSWFDLSKLKETCKRYGEYAVCAGHPGYLDLINGTAFGRGTERVLLDLVTEDPVGLAIIDRRFNFCCDLFREMLTAAGGLIDIIWFGDDYGTQRGLLISPQLYRSFFKPKLKKLIDLAHTFGARVMFHSCGSNRELMEEFIEIGTDCFQTAQPHAAGMDPKELKENYGSRLAFHGTIDAQGDLQRLSPAEIREMVRERIRVMAPGGGFICAPSHMIQPDTPPENVAAMYEAIQEYGAY